MYFDENKYKITYFFQYFNNNLPKHKIYNVFLLKSLQNCFLSNFVLILVKIHYKFNNLLKYFIYF